jgi:UMF1 family MFS transporter
MRILEAFKMGKRAPVIGWSLYDFATTIFSMNIISLYFVLWVTVDHGRQDIVYSIALSGSLLIAALLEPLLGAVSDIFRKRMPFLVLFTCVACAGTAFLGLVRGLLAGLVTFAFANLTYQIATVFYNALLVRVAGRGEIGRVSGLGAALGYVGAIVGLVVTRPFVLRYGYQGAFVPTAALFFIFSLPCFFLVKEPAREAGQLSEMRMGAVFSRIKDTFSSSGKYPGLLRFLIAAFIFLNAVNTVIVFMSVYLRKVAGFDDRSLIAIYLVSTFMAILGSLFFGVLTDRLGAKKAVIMSLSLWFACLVLGAFAWTKAVFWIIGPLIGIALGSVWTTSRALTIGLCPEEKLGEMFGLLGMVGKSAAIIGPLIWGVTILVLDFLGAGKYRIAILLQSFFILAGLFVVRKVPYQDEQPAGI